MVQARHVQALLRTRFPEHEVAIESEPTSGDLILDKSLAELASQSPGLFTKELERGLYAGTVDVVVHSLKDMPTLMPPGLSLVAITEVRSGAR
jgi:hydroxymethylbilane synthase